jgi:hypothetical protein
MRRSLLILLALVLAGAAVFFAGNRIAARWNMQQMAQTTDDLAWLRMEYRLSDAEMSRVRGLHQGYMVVCSNYCARIEAQKRELQLALNAGANAQKTVEAKLAEIGQLRAQCQAAMLQHFREVSQVMPPEQGRRYLAEMERLALGIHEQMENSMSHDASSPHGHH